MTKRFGNLLLEAGIVSAEQLKEALERKARYGGRLASNCLSMGLADERTLALVLGHQQGVPFLVLSRSVIPLNLLDDFPLETARKLSAFPVHRDQRELYVAFSDPTNIATLDEIRFTTGMRIVEHGAVSAVLHDFIEEAYRQRQSDHSEFYQGSDFDPATTFGEAGHIEIAMGRELSSLQGLKPKTPAPGPPAPNPAMDLDWSDELIRSGQAGAERDKTTVLLVEDEDELRKMLRIFLEKSGYAVREAADGTEALRSLQESLPDALVLDAMLPGIHGFDICSRVKKSESTRHIPVVMVSAVYRGWRYADDVRRLHGADAFLEKPLRLEELKHVLQQCLMNKPQGTNPEMLNAQATQTLRKAAEAYRTGDLFGSAHQLQKAVEIAPFSATLHERLGVVFDRLDEPYRAIAEIERAVELNSTFQRLVTLARLYEKTGFSAKAYESWERCLRSCEDEQEMQKIREHMETLLPRG